MKGGGVTTGYEGMVGGGGNNRLWGCRRVTADNGGCKIQIELGDVRSTVIII